jgi:glutathione S-transferase
LNEIYFEQVIKPVAGMGETNIAACEKAAKFAHSQLKLVDRWLGSRDWLANDAFSIAEPFALGYMEQAHVVGFGLDEHPNVQAWLARLEERDATARARERVRPHQS